MIYVKLPPILELYEHSGDSIEAQDAYYLELIDLGIACGAGERISVQESLDKISAIMESDMSNDEQYCLLRVLEVDLENHAEDRVSIDHVIAAQWELTCERNNARIDSL